jgi:hypothetical protein
MIPSLGLLGDTTAGFRAYLSVTIRRAMDRLQEAAKDPQ